MSEVLKYKAIGGMAQRSRVGGADYVMLSDYDALHQRLSDAEKFVQKMVDQTKGQDSVATGYLSDILDVIKGNPL